jgi:NADH pyrophosphatase NudC (nudix superfamily)
MNYCFSCGKALSTKEIDGKERLYCTAPGCGYIHWNNPVPVVGILVETAEGIILANHKNTPKRFFSIITGFLEADESPEQAAIRETREELGLDVLSTEFLGVLPFQRANQIVIAFHARATGVIRLNEELVDYKVVQRNDLYGYATNNRFEIQDWLNRLNVLA